MRLQRFGSCSCNRRFRKIQSHQSLVFVRARPRRTETAAVAHPLPFGPSTPQPALKVNQPTNIKFNQPPTVINGGSFFQDLFDKFKFFGGFSVLCFLAFFLLLCFSAFLLLLFLCSFAFLFFCFFFSFVFRFFCLFVFFCFSAVCFSALPASPLFFFSASLLFYASPFFCFSCFFSLVFFSAFLFFLLSVAFLLLFLLLFSFFAFLLLCFCWLLSLSVLFPFSLVFCFPASFCFSAVSFSFCLSSFKELLLLYISSLFFLRFFVLSLSYDRLFHGSPLLGIITLLTASTTMDGHRGGGTLIQRHFGIWLGLW